MFRVFTRNEILIWFQREWKVFFSGAFLVDFHSFAVNFISSRECFRRRFFLFFSLNPYLSLFSLYLLMWKDKRHTISMRIRNVNKIINSLCSCQHKILERERSECAFSDQESAIGAGRVGEKKVKWKKRREMTDKKVCWDQGRRSSKSKSLCEIEQWKSWNLPFFPLFTMIFVSHAGFAVPKLSNF